MSFFKTAQARLRAILMLSTASALLPAPTQAVPEAPWNDSPAPFVFHNEVIDVTQDKHITRGLHLEGVSGVRVAPGRTLQLQGPILGHPVHVLAPMPFWKLGAGHLELTGASTTVGQIVLAEGSLGLAHDDALGAAYNQLEIRAGTRLELRPGAYISQDLEIRSAATAQTPPPYWSLPPLSHLPDAAVLRVPSGLATLAGGIQSDTAIIKDGAGTLRLSGSNYSVPGQPLHLAQGGLQVDYTWAGSLQSQPGTVLSGIGWVDQARLAGHLQPGTPEAPGTLMFGDRLALMPSAQTRIRIDAAG